jgi:hypothetical protein
MSRSTPSAVPVPDPKLERMSRRTTPSSVSTFGPFEPSPGYGPAVSSGIGSPQSEASADDVLVEDVVDVDVDVDDDEVVEDDGSRPQAPRATRPAPASSFRA